MKKRLCLAIISIFILVCVCLTACNGKNTPSDESIAHVHDTEYVIGVQADCTHDGRITYWHCLTCDKYFSDVAYTKEISFADTFIAKHHTVNKVDYRAAACTEDGHEEYFYCTVCGKSFSSGSCTEEVDASALVLPKLGHKGGVHFVEAKTANCTTSGCIAHYHCDLCDKDYEDKECTRIILNSKIDAFNHYRKQYKEGYDDEDNGLHYIEHYYCPDCRKYFTDPTCTNEISVSEIAVSPSLNFSLQSDDTYLVSNVADNAANIVIPAVYNGKKVVGIKDGAFKGNTYIKMLVIGENIQKLPASAFEGCVNIERIVFNAKNCADLKMNNQAFYDVGINTDGVEVVFGKEVAKVPAFLFYPRQGGSNYPKIKSVSFADDSQCQKIGDYAFYGCVDMRFVQIPQKIASIGTRAFYGCVGLSEIYYNAVSCADCGTVLGDHNGAFSITGDGNAKLTVGASVEKIPDFMFANTQIISLIEFEEDGVCTYIGNYAFYNCKTLSVLDKIPEEITVAEDAFAGTTVKKLPKEED